jgi:hypothetical protein
MAQGLRAALKAVQALAAAAASWAIGGAVSEKVRRGELVALAAYGQIFSPASQFTRGGVAPARQHQEVRCRYRCGLSGTARISVVECGLKSSGAPADPPECSVSSKCRLGEGVVSCSRLFSAEHAART